MSIDHQIKPSQFRVHSLGMENAINPTYNPRCCYVGSEDYFQDQAQLTQLHWEEQMLQLLEQQSGDLQNRIIDKRTVAEMQQNHLKKKKVFDSADYYMKQYHHKQLTVEQQQEEALMIRHALRGKQLIKKQKKIFDSADYFLNLYKN